ncbi:MAG: hypothetical protein RSE41_06990 [Clostridia bacterium]
MNEKPSSKKTLHERFNDERIEWTNKLKELAQKSRYLDKLTELQVDVISERQIAVDYYHHIKSVLISLNREFKVEYAKKYDFYTNGSNIRYPNESSKNAKIQSDLCSIIEKKDSLENHMSFMQETIKTIDNLIFGIKHRLSIEEFVRGLK